MIKICGMALVVLCCSMAGISAASGLSRRVAAIENIIRLCQHLRDRLKYMRPSVAMLVGQAAASPEFEELEFLSQCDRRMREGEIFAESWRSSVRGSSALIGRDAADIVGSLADVLGASDLESQLSALDYGIATLESRLCDAREYSARHQKLYRTLGVLAGFGIAVFMA